MRRLLRRASYSWGPRIASAARKRWLLWRHPHCDIRFEGPVYLGPGFSFFCPEGGTFVVGPHVEFRRGFPYSASGAWGALSASKCGSTTAWVCAWGRSNMPPSTWQILWCSPDPADANATAAR